MSKPWWIIAIAAAATGALVWIVQLLAAAAPSGIDPLGGVIDTAPDSLRATGLALGLTLLGAYLAGKAAAALGLAKITGFLVFGALVGPYTLNLISADTLERLQLANGLAISLIALTAGGEIELGFIRKSLKSISIILICEMTAVGIATAAAGYLILDVTGMVEGMPLNVKVLIACIIAVVMIANSPAVVIAIIAETRARGPLAQSALAVSVMKDLCLIILFALVIAVTQTQIKDIDPSTIGAPAAAETVAQSQQPAEAEPDTEPRPQPPTTDSADPDQQPEQTKAQGSVTWKIGGSLLVGALIGVLLAVYAKFVNAHMAFFIVGSAFAIALISQQILVEPLIVALTAGLVMRNLFGSSTGSFFHTLEDLSLPVYALFFAVAGAKIEWGSLASVAHWVALLLVVRYSAVWVGAYLGTRLAGMEKPAANWLWTGFVPQAGIAIALAIVVRDTFPRFAFDTFLFALLLSTIAINELIGPILFKLGLARAGETHDTNTKPTTAHTND